MIPALFDVDCYDPWHCLMLIVMIPDIEWILEKTVPCMITILNLGSFECLYHKCVQIKNIVDTKFISTSKTINFYKNVKANIQDKNLSTRSKKDSSSPESNLRIWQNPLRLIWQANLGQVC